jgi:DNA polymerase III epsilon subunit-like protein
MMYTLFFDLETGGLELRHPVIQMAAIAIREDDWQEVGTFERKLSFDEALADQKALEMNHYDREQWQREAIHPDQAVRDFAKWCAPFRCIEMTSKAGSPYSVAKLAGHNIVAFDLPRLRALFGSQFFPFSYHAKDTLQRALWYFDEHPEVKRPASLKQGVLCEAFGIPVDGAHDALTDVRMAAALARALSRQPSFAEAV